MINPSEFQENGVIGVKTGNSLDDLKVETTTYKAKLVQSIMGLPKLQSKVHLYIEYVDETCHELMLAVNRKVGKNLIFALGGLPEDGA